MIKDVMTITHQPLFFSISCIIYFLNLSLLIVKCTDIHFAKTREKIVCHNVQIEKVETV